jgi:hypothetical protein
MTTTFTPSPGGSTTISVTTSTASKTIQGQPRQIRLYNSGDVAVFVRWGKGSQSAVTTDMAIAPGATEAFTKEDADTIAAITASGSATLYITCGTGE